MTGAGSLPTPALILAADHRARGVMTTENYVQLVQALGKALPHCDGILATAQPLGDLVHSGHVTAAHHVQQQRNHQAERDQAAPEERGQVPGGERRGG